MGIQRFVAPPCVELNRIPGAPLLSTSSFAARTFCGVPYLHIAVAASGYELRALGVVVDAEYVARMSLEDSARQALPRRQLSNGITVIACRRMVHTESTSHIRMV